MTLLLCAMLAGCVAGPPAHLAAWALAPGNMAPDPLDPSAVHRRLQALGPAGVLLLGEQHDVPAHQQLQRAVVQALAAQGTLAAVALEMAEQGATTATLAPDASEALAQAVLRWDAAAWPWAAYGPVVMTAVRAGVPVLGANLPRAQIRDAMKSVALDDHLTPGSWQKQQENIRQGHCGLLPESQIVPMTRVQTARDAAMARTLLAARQPGKTVLLIAGNGHVDREVGVPTHLGRDLLRKTVMLGAMAQVHPASSDALWATPAPPPRDHCAELQRQMAPGR